MFTDRLNTATTGFFVDEHDSLSTGCSFVQGEIARYDTPPMASELVMGSHQL